MFARRLSGRLVLCTLGLAIGVCGALAQAADTIDPSKLKKGDELEVKVGRNWVKATFVEPFSSQLIHVKRDDFPVPVGAFLSDVRLPARGRGGVGASAAENPFATEEERIAARQPRTWSDASGKFKVEAKLLRVDGDNVVIKRADDKELAVPLARLSDADKKYVASIVPGTSTDSPAEESAEAMPAREVELTETHLGAARVVQISGRDWNYQPDASPTERKLRNVRIPLKEIEFLASVELFLLPDQGRAFVAAALSHGSEQKATVQAIDLQRGLVVGEGVFSNEVTPIDMSLDGKWILARSQGFGTGTSAELRLYERKGMNAEPKVAWVPYNHHGPATEWAGRWSYPWNADVEWAKFLGSEHVVTLSHDNELAVWQIDGLKPIYQAKLSSWSRPTFSAGENYLAMTVPEGIAILHAATGATAGVLPQENAGGPSLLAFSPDGTKLASCTYQGHLRVWDLTTQKLIREFSVSPSGGSTSARDLAWLDDKLLLRGDDVVDVEHYCTVWSSGTTPHREAYAVLEDQLWRVERPHGGALITSMSVPPASVRDQWAKVPAEAAVVIRPGMEVAVDIQVADQYADEARQAIVDSLTRRGMKVVPEADLKLVAKIELGKTETMNYETRQFGRPFSRSTTQVNVQRQIGTLSYELGGKTVWKREQHGGAPWHMHLKEGENIQQAAQDKARLDSRIFQKMWVPVTVADKDKVAQATPSS
ncbi:MAG: hypothetical protein DWQ37_21655 [Planctomycetota bacterium]|nr:MAG: hypothetical protein DWQ37_21655 [Planctomycetota bacterium]